MNMNYEKGNIINEFIVILKNELLSNNITYKENDRELILLCPFCLNEHKYKIKLYISKENLLYNCFRCENSGNIFTLGKIFKMYYNHGINLEQSYDFYQNYIMNDDIINYILKNNSKKNKYINFTTYFTKNNDLEEFYFNQVFISEKFNKIREIINKNDIYENNLKYLSKRLSLNSDYIKFYLKKDNNINDFISLNISDNEIYNFTFYKFYSEKRNIRGKSRYYKYKLMDLDREKYLNNYNNFINSQIEGINDNYKSNQKQKFIITYPDFSLIKMIESNNNNKKSLLITEGMFDLLSIYFYGLEYVIKNYIYTYNKRNSLNVFERKLRENILEDVMNSNIYLSHLSGYKNYERFFYFIKMLYYTHNFQFNNIILLLDRDINLKSLNSISNIVKSVYLPHLESIYDKKISFDIYRINSLFGKDINELVQKI